MAKTQRVAQEHGRNAYLDGRCKCDEICRKAVRDYSREYGRRRGAKPATYKDWTEPELHLMRTSTLTNLELVPLLPGRTFYAIERKRSKIRGGLLQRGLTVPHPGARGQRAWNRKTRLPLPELVRGSRVRNIRTGVVYRICGVQLDEEYVWLDRVDTMHSRLLKKTFGALIDQYEGVQNKNASVSSGDSSEPPS